MLKDLEIPTILAINMADQMNRKGIDIDIELLKQELKTEIILISSRKNIGIDNSMTAVAAAGLVSILALSNASSRLISGTLSDKLGVLTMLKVIFIK